MKKPLELILATLLLAPLSLVAQQSGKFSFDFKAPEKGGTVKVKADRQGSERGEYTIFEGNVEIAYGDVVIHADRVTHNEKTQDVVAEGHVVLDQGTRRLAASRMVYNLTTETGTFWDASGSFEPSIYFRAKSIEKIAEQTYRLDDGIFTSCDIDDPDWSFEIGSGVVTLDDYARLRNVAVKAGRLPLLWTPYIVWPTKEERARGFLTPKVGFRSRFGSYLGTSYFVPIGDSADATLNADVHTEGYYGLGTDVRYVPSQSVTGRLSAYAVTDPEYDTVEWKYSYVHADEDLPGGFRGVIDVKDFSDLDFFRFYERDFEINTISNIYSSAYLTKSWSNYSLNIRADRREQFLSGGVSDTFEQLPAIQLTQYPTRIGRSPVYLALESSASHLRTSFGGNYFRGDLFPTVSVQMKTPTWLSIKPQVSLRQTWYTASREPGTRNIVDEGLSRSYAQGQVEMVGPSFSRVFDRKLGGFSRFKHVIEPRARYLYTSDVEEQDRVIRFDTVDSPYFPLVRETIEYEMINRIIAKEGADGNAREIMSVSVKQSASLADPFRQFVGGQLVETETTPVTATLRVNPYQSIALDAGLVYGNVTDQIDQVNLSANLAPGGGTRYLNFTWFARFEDPATGTGESSQFRVSTGVPIWKDRFRLDAAVNYDATREDLLEQRYFFRYNASCYNIGLEMREFQEYRTGTPRANRDIRLSIDLKNVGSFPINLPGTLDSVFRF
ncbi:MAG TPA: LPS assembly protein LptD [Thermoanaerobaculia bacterium]